MPKIKKGKLDFQKIRICEKIQKEINKYIIKKQPRNWNYKYWDGCV